MPNDVLVSVQATGMELRPWDGHVCVGLLASEDIVAVPVPVEDLLDPRRGFEALIIPVSLKVDDLIERIGIFRIDASRRVDGTLSYMVLKLSRWSKYAPMISTFEGSRLAEELEEHGNLWTALKNMRAVRPDLPEDPPPEMLRAVPDIETEQRKGRISMMAAATWWPCSVLPCCRE
jgi:hypothetical protein